MNCPKCGADCTDDSKFCVSCGEPLNQPEVIWSEEAAPDAEASEPENHPQKKAGAPKTRPRSIIGVLIGAVLVIIGIARVLTAGTSISSTSFGGDFYTYTYQGIVAISEILASVEVSLGWVIAAIGAAIGIFSWRPNGGQ